MSSLTFLKEIFNPDGGLEICLTVRRYRRKYFLITFGGVGIGSRLITRSCQALGFCTVLSLRIFVAEKVDVAILEVGLGGRLDATNVVKAPVACGIASLGFDHMELLGI